MNRAVSGVLSGLICLAISGCGPTYWKAQLDTAASLQERSVSAQAGVKEAAPKQGWLLCNVMTIVVAERAGAVLDRAAEEARGVEGAALKRSAAEDAAKAAKPLMVDACELAARIAALFGAPVPVVSPALVPASVAPPLPAPATPAPTGGTMPAVTAPAGLAPVPPVGVSSPAPPAAPVVPAAPAVTP